MLLLLEEQTVSELMQSMMMGIQWLLELKKSREWIAVRAFLVTRAEGARARPDEAYYSSE